MPIGYREVRQKDLAELQTDIRPFRDHERVFAGVRILIVGEQPVHLVCRLHVELIRAKLEPFLIRLVGTGLDAQQHVMGVVLVGMGVVDVVCRQERCTDLSGDAGQIFEDASLRRDPVILQFDEVVFFTEYVLILGRRLDGGRVVTDLLFVALLRIRIGRKQLRNVAAKAPGCRGYPFGIAREEFHVHPRLVIVPIKICLGCELDQVAVAHIAKCVQQHMMAHIVASWRAIMPIPGRGVCLESDDRLNPGSSRCLVEIEHAVEDTVIRQPDRRLVVRYRSGNDVVDASGAVEHRKLSVKMKMGKLLAHGRTGSG
ncbi:hypothetical protein BMS3Bbin02_01451 [bacterium BMS3Bbin02]|nr:hypothetical protein BMS3Bbin02_01451 [bacterium BMS3Bbin02]